MEFAQNWGGPVIGLTATPFTPGLGLMYDGVVNVETTNRLVDEGWLVPLQVYAAKEIDMTGAAKKMGEWSSSEVRKRGAPIIGEIVSEWVEQTQRHYGGPVKTLVFSADIAHGAELCARFQLAGYDFRQSTYRDTPKETHRLIEGYRRGEFTGLVSVEKFVKGFDVPDVRCIVGARPYSSSLASVIQQMGRGMRPAPGKDSCLYIDHAGNMVGWYDDILGFWDQGCHELDRTPKPAHKRKEGRERPEVLCYGCGYVLQPEMTHCPSCGRERQKSTKYTTASGKVAKLPNRRSSSLPRWTMDKRWMWGQMCAVALNWKKGEIDPARRLARAQYHDLYDEWPPGDWEIVEGMEYQAAPNPNVRRKMIQQIKDWKEREAK